MLIGTATQEITPAAGCELSGFAARVQPSTHVRDPLYAKCLFARQGGEQMLWLACDLIGLERSFVLQAREAIQAATSVPASRVMISCTHTHAGPTTMHLSEAGEYDPAYLEALLPRLVAVATAATAHPCECTMLVRAGNCSLAIDRRNKPSAHTDHQLGVIAWVLAGEAADGGPGGAGILPASGRSAPARTPARSIPEYAAVLLNYPMHAVALGPANRGISADWPGRTAETITAALPGNPIVLVTNGACGNINPPFENITTEQLNDWSDQVAHAALAAVQTAASNEESLHVAARVVTLPLDALTVEQVATYAEWATGNVRGIDEWGDKFRRAIAAWSACMSRPGACERYASCEIELMGVRFGPAVFMGVSAEIFSRFTAELRGGRPGPVYTVGYANGLNGYIAPEAAYDEGGYETELAHLFYNSFRFKRGALEQLAAEARTLLNAL